MTGVEVTDDIDRMAGVEFYNGILIPDMVDAHCHLELSYLRGQIPRGSGFAGFAKVMGEVRRQADAQTRLRAAADADRDLWRQGVGAVVDICNSSETFETKTDSAIEYVNEAELYGLNADSAAPMERLVSCASDLGLRAAVTPHSIYSLSDAAFRAAVAASDGSGLPLSIHFMESPAEAELFAGRGPLAEWYAVRGWTTDFLHYGSPARRIVESVPADRDVLLVHDCCVDEEAVDMIEEHFTGRVTWVLCPRSNDYISGLVPPVELLGRKGVHVALGTDSLASNDSLDMASEIAALGRVPLVDALVWATEEGAAAIGAQDRMGAFEPGRRSGAVLLTGVDFDSMTLRSDARTVRLL